MATLTWPLPGDDLDDLALADSVAAVPSSVVPATYPIAIAGHPYKLELDSYGTGIRGVTYRRTTLDVFRASADQSATPGEQTLSTEGYWLRSERSFLYGAGQLLFDSLDDGVDNLVRRQRWLDNWNCEPDDVEGLKMLRRQATPYSASSVGIYRNGNQAVQAGTGTYFLHLVSGSPVVKVVNSSGVTDCTGFAGTSPQAIATDGYHVFVATGPSTTTVAWYQATGGSVFTAMAAGVQAVGTHDRAVALYANGVLLIAVNGSIYSVDSTGAHSAVIDTVSPVSGTTPTCVAATASTNYWYFAFASNIGGGQPTTIYKLTVDSGGLFSKLTVALPALSSNEFVQCMLAVDSETMIIGTNAGFHLATINASTGALALGPLNQLTSDISSANTGVTALAKMGSNIVASFWEDRFSTNVDASFQGSTAGLIVIDLGHFAAPSQPSWWFWWRAATTSANTICYVGGNLTAPIVLVDQTFYVLGTANLVTPCSLVTSWVSFGLDASKSYIDLELFHDMLATGDSIKVYYQAEDSTTWNLIGTSQQVGTISNPDPFLLGVSSRRLRFAFVMVAGSAAQTTTPRIRRWVLRAYPAPQLTDEIMLPVVLFDKILVGEQEAVEAHCATRDEYDFLAGLAQSGEIVIFQEGSHTERVKVSKLELQPAKFSIDADGGYGFYQGWCVVRLLSL